MKAEHTRHLILTVLLLLLMFAASIPWRMPHVDDAWLGEHSYWLASEGVVKSKLMTGIAGGEERLVMHHKLHTWVGALIIKTAGFKLHWLKTVSLAFYVLTIIVTLKLGRKTGLVIKPYEQLMVVLLLLAHPLLFEFGFVFRPEMMLAFMALLSFWFLHQSVNNHASGSWLAFASGVFAGLGLLTHLNGSMFIAAGFLSLLVFRRYGGAALFALGATMSSALYFLDFKGLDDFSLWYHQLTFLPDGRVGNAWWMNLLLNLGDEHMRYFHSPVEISFTVLILFTLYTNGKVLWNVQRLLLIYTLIAMFFLGLLALHKTSKYLIPVIPFWSLMIVHSLSEPIPSQKVRWIAIGLAMVFLAVSMVYNTQVVLDKYDTRLNEQIRMAFAGKDSETLKVAAPMEFIFDEIDNFEAIQGLMSWSELHKIDPSLKGEALLHKARAQDIDIILLSKQTQRTFNMKAYEEGIIFEGYLLNYKTPELMVWSRVPADDTLTEQLKVNYNDGWLNFSGAIK